MPRIIHIGDLADPRLDPYRNVRDRDLRGRAGSFMAEGTVVLGNAASRSRHPLASMLVSASRLDKLAPVLDSLPDDFPVYCAPPDVLDEIAGFHIHRGVLAHGERSPDPGPEALLDGLSANALVIAVFGISNHDNIGGIFRNAVAFGVDAVLLDPACCDPLYRKAIRVSVGASLICPFARAQSDAHLIGALAKTGLQRVALRTDGDASFEGLPAKSGIALLIGSEGHGLPDTAKHGATGLRIAMVPGIDSLNAATATGIALHATARMLGKI